ncbi:hypothetical protein [Haloferula sp.]|uniref:hypothetical protein n=1 Tax=Haloferula sp. TaxID=2497595 RepID=UPI003C721BE1
MKTILNSGLVLVLAMASLGAEETQESQIDLEARKATIPIVEERVKERENQVSKIAHDILGLHQQLDEKLESVVEHLSGIKDSERSGYRVGKLKMAAIEQLQNTIDTFRTKRAALVAELQSGRTGLSPEMVDAEVEHLDSHVEKHIAQMLKLSKSFTQDENVQKFETVGGGGYYDSGYGWYEDTVEITDEWKQNRRDRSMDRKQRDAVVGALKESIEHCEGRVGALRDNLKRGRLSEAEREVVQQELDSHLGMLKTRREQVDGLLIVEDPNTVEVSRDVARDMEEALGDLVDDMQRDLRLIVLKHSQLNREQSKLQALKENLEARKAWIEEYEESENK